MQSMGKLILLWKRRDEWEEKSEKGGTPKGFLIILSSLLY